MTKKKPTESANLKNTKLENFDLQLKTEHLLAHSQQIINQYDTLLYRLQSITNDLNSPLSLVFNDIINSYYSNIEINRRTINLLGGEIRKFNASYNVKNYKAISLN